MSMLVPFKYDASSGIIGKSSLSLFLYPSCETVHSFGLLFCCSPFKIVDGCQQQTDSSCESCSSRTPTRLSLPAYTGSKSPWPAATPTSSASTAEGQPSSMHKAARGEATRRLRLEGTREARRLDLLRTSRCCLGQMRLFNRTFPKLWDIRI